MTPERDRMTHYHSPVTQTYTEAAAEAARVLAEKTGVERHDIALVMGSGWLPAVDALGEATAEISTTDLPGFAPPAVAGHAGKIRSVRSGEKNLLVFLGRTHFYEGLGVRAVVHGVRTAAAAGCSTRRTHQRLRRPRRALVPRHPGADQRPHQPDRDLPDRGRQLRRPHRPLQPPAARAVPGGRRRPSTRASTCSSPARTTRPPPRSAWSARSAAPSSA